tara:strand:+ start:5917 stop:6369 length:453 start_codon:yes stop_codon:yes gene_type:complete
MDDDQNAHQQFSTSCFNGVWELLEKKGRSEADDEMMREMAHASLFHWLKRDDCRPQNLSIGYWQLSRVYAALSKAEAARVYGERCLKVSEDLPPFFLGYAHEALARAAKIGGKDDAFAEHLATAKTQAEQVENEEERQLLVADLAELGEK